MMPMSLRPNAHDIIRTWDGDSSKYEREIIKKVKGNVKIPVIGMGGVSSAEDIIEMMLAGATAVEVGAANLVDPCACRKIIEQLPAVMDQYHINTLREIIGGTN